MKFALTSILSWVSVLTEGEPPAINLCSVSVPVESEKSPLCGGGSSYPMQCDVGLEVTHERSLGGPNWEVHGSIVIKSGVYKVRPLSSVSIRLESDLLHFLSISLGSQHKLTPPKEQRKLIEDDEEESG